jgi:two-component system, OmpR family, KDP operon response regulator KdpE
MQVRDAFPARGCRNVSAGLRVLVVDDEEAILRFLKPALEANSYQMSSAATVADAVKRIAADAPDVVLLDLGLPDGDGKDVLRRVREWSDVPVIVLSARDREAEKIESLDLGADDYVNKPFNVGELMARMRAALRHRMQRKAETPLLRVGDFEVDAVRHRVTRAGVELKLTPKEFELLLFLAKNAGRVLTHRQILAAVWGVAHTSDTQYLRVYVGQLRQKIEDKADDPRIILTEPGIGYRISES